MQILEKFATDQKEQAQAKNCSDETFYHLKIDKITKLTKLKTYRLIERTISNLKFHE